MFSMETTDWNVADDGVYVDITSVMVVLCVVVYVWAKRELL